jgi:hypothetical protein
MDVPAGFLWENGSAKPRNAPRLSSPGQNSVTAPIRKPVVIEHHVAQYAEVA